MAYLPDPFAYIACGSAERALCGEYNGTMPFQPVGMLCGIERKGAAPADIPQIDAETRINNVELLPIQARCNGEGVESGSRALPVAP
jgi:hypothetical protein